MTNIGRVDHVLLQLREQLQRIAKARAKGGAGSASKVDAGPLARLQRADGDPAITDEEFRRKFVRALLTEEFGDAFGNQPEFDRISQDVSRMLDADEDTRRLMDQAIRQLGIAP